MPINIAKENPLATVMKNSAALSPPIGKAGKFISEKFEASVVFLSDRLVFDIFRVPLLEQRPHKS